MTGQMTLGNGTVESFTLNERFQLTSQSLTRGSEVLQKFDYAYGQIDGSGNLDPAKRRPACEDRSVYRSGEAADAEVHLRFDRSLE